MVTDEFTVSLVIKFDFLIKKDYLINLRDPWNMTSSFREIIKISLYFMYFLFIMSNSKQEPTCFLLLL